MEANGERASSKHDQVSGTLQRKAEHGSFLRHYIPVSFTYSALTPFFPHVIKSHSKATSSVRSSWVPSTSINCTVTCKLEQLYTANS